MYLWVSAAGRDLENKIVCHFKIPYGVRNLQLLSRLPDDRELIHGHGRQFTVREFEDDGIAEHLVIVVTAMMQTVPPPLRTNYFTDRRRRPALLPHRDRSFYFDPVAGRQLVESCLLNARYLGHELPPE